MIAIGETYCSEISCRVRSGDTHLVSRPLLISPLFQGSSEGSPFQSPEVIPLCLQTLVTKGGTMSGTSWNGVLTRRTSNSRAWEVLPLGDP